LHSQAHFCGAVCDLEPAIVVCVSGALVIDLSRIYAFIQSLTTPTLQRLKCPVYCSRSPRLGQDLSGLGQHLRGHAIASEDAHLVRTLGQDLNYANSSLLNRSANIAYSSPNYTSTSPAASPNIAYSSPNHTSTSPAASYIPSSPSTSLSATFGKPTYSSPLTSKDGRVLGQ